MEEMRGLLHAIGANRRRTATRLSLTAFALSFVLPSPAGAFVGARVEDGHLVARSDSNSDIIKVSCGTDLQVKVNGLNPTGGAAPCSAIRRVRVLGFGGADTINVTRVGPRNGFTNPALRHLHAVQALGGASADRICGSRLSDLLAGGGGRDVLRGRDGADLLRGGTGGDRVLGGAGNDRLLGGRGRDFLRGGRGNDVDVDL
jgi:Ca2+-binding RTX toxin-like protein